MLGLLAQCFFSMFKSNRNLVVLLYGISDAMLAINAAFTLAFVGAITINSVPYVQSFVGASVACSINAKTKILMGATGVFPAHMEF